MTPRWPSGQKSWRAAVAPLLAILGGRGRLPRLPGCELYPAAANDNTTVITFPYWPLIFTSLGKNNKIANGSFISSSITYTNYSGDITFYTCFSDAPRSVWVNVSSEVMEGTSVTLHCEVDSNPPPRISWLFGGNELLWDTAANLSLSLDDVTPTKEGIYTCVGDNGYGVMNTSMYLAVKCK